MRRSLLIIGLSLAACDPKDEVPSDDSAVPDDSAPFVDEDGDGYSAEEDCDDSTPGVNPGAVEVCDGLDNNCDGVADEGVLSTYYTDADGDGFGGVESVEACSAPSGAVNQGGDCDDADPRYYPGAEESDCSDPNDYNCDGSVGYADGDGDGFAACQECDDSAADINPLATELCDTLDNDCDGTVDEPDAADAATWYQDADADGYGDPDYTTLACSAPSGYVADASDCDDSSNGINPGATEQCNTLDDNCDGQVDEAGAEGELSWYPDTDSDGYGASAGEHLSCEQPSGFVADSTDCDDAATAVNPGATELCNGLDDNCDGTIDEDSAADAGTWYADADGDGYGDPSTGVTTCDTPSGYGTDSSDCDDSDAWSNPAASELNDGADNDCDGSTDEDLYLGAGDDGALSVSSTVDLSVDPSGTRTDADAIAWPVTAISSDTLTIDGTVSGLDVGDEVIVVNMHGSDSAYSRVGTYEFASVIAASGTSITLAQPLAATFGEVDNTDLTDQAVFVQRVPHYSKVTVSSGGLLTTSPWDGRTGGLLAFRASGTIRVDSGGSIAVDELGYWGGATGSAYNYDSFQGESYAGEGDGEGGGAGVYNEAYGYWIYNYGGGGAHINGGGGNHAGGATAGDSWTGGSATAPYAGLTYGQADLSTLFFGSGGGGVWQGTSSCTGSGPGPGGDGGGVLIVTGSKVQTYGTDGLSARGGSTTACAQGSWTYGAGGGAGGSIWVVADTVSLAASSVSAEGGLGESRNIRKGGDGGYGRVRVDCTTCNTYKNGSASATTALNDASEPDPGYSATP